MKSLRMVIMALSLVAVGTTATTIVSPNAALAKGIEDAGG